MLFSNVIFKICMIFAFGKAKTTVPENVSVFAQLFKNHKFVKQIKVNLILLSFTEVK